MEDEDSGADVALGTYLLTPGPVRRRYEGREIITSINGRFAGWEEIAGSEDRYLILEGVSSEFSRLRVVAQSDKTKGIFQKTQISVINQIRDVPLYDRLRLVGEFGDLSKEQVDFFFQPGIWLKAIFYRDGTRHFQDEQGAYYVRAINVNETPEL